MGLMDNNRPYTLSNLWHFSHPMMLLAGILIYALGGGAAHYLGYIIDWGDYWVGQGIITFLQLSSYYLKLYFELPKIPDMNRDDKKTTEGNQPCQITLTRARLLPLIYSFLTIWAMFTALLFANGHNNILIIGVLVIGFFIAFFYGIPPLKLVYTGYGELTQAVLLANIVPAFAYVIQTGQLQRLLVMMTFPLTFLYIAMVLCLSLATYASDIRSNRKTLMIRIGWQSGMRLHNILVLIAYLIFFLAYFIGLPRSLTWPGLLTIPVAVFQIYQLNQIAGGVRPRWKLLEYASVSTFLFTAYFLTLALWTR
jgi:1,4-dihydroxy-2-naphthoate octaprenyltransferase